MSSNKQAICDVLLALSNENPDITVLCSDSRGSASATEFSEKQPGQFIELGIAEQNLVSVAAGLASCNMRPFILSPACFISTRSMEQVKVDVCYSNTNVKLIGVSGGVSYGALGMTHHAIHDIATLGILPGLRFYLPSDEFASKALIQRIALDSSPAYIRVGRNASPRVYTEDYVFPSDDKAITVREGNDIAIIACGDLVRAAADAADELQGKGISCRVLDMYCIKPIDKEAIKKAATETKAIVTIEEHSTFLGLGALVAKEMVGIGTPLKIMGLPDSPVITGKQQEVFDYYGLNKDGIVKVVCELWEN